MTPRARSALELLQRSNWVCGVEFVEAGIGWAFSTRISEVRRSGYAIRKKRCRRPEHDHRSVIWEYSIAPSTETDRGE